MSVTNLLSNQESQTIKELTKKIERGHFDLSHTTTFPMEVGKLYPICCLKTLPGDSFKINVGALLRQLQPMLVPQMTSFKLITAFYWTDYRLAYPKISRFFINQSGSDLLNLPYLLDNNTTEEDPDDEETTLHAITKTAWTRTLNGTSEDDTTLSGNLRSYLNISKEESIEKIDAMPVWTYNSIFANYYMPLDRISEDKYNYYFPANPDDIHMKDGANYKFNHNSDFDESYFGLKYHTIRDDYFSSTYPSPMRGSAPTLELGGITTTLDWTDVFKTSPDTYTTLSDQAIVGTYEDGNGNKFLQGGAADAPNNRFYPNDTITKGLKSTFEKVDAKAELYSAVTEQQLRTLSALTVWKETSMLTKPNLHSYVNAHYNQSIGEQALDAPIFIGGTSQDITVNEIQQTSSTTETSALGQTGATTHSLATNNVGSFYSKFFGCLMGIAYILPDYTYEPAIPKMWQERTVEEWYSPEFNHLSMQPVLNKELYVSNSDEWNNQVLGYNGQYDQYRMLPNHVSGLLLSDYDDINIFSQVRRFSNENKPEITETFLRADLAFDKNIFAVPEMPPFIVQFANYIDSVRPIPQVATPSSEN